MAAMQYVPKDSELSLPSASHDQIAALAHQYWQEEGCPQGRDLELWLRAEGELQDQAASTLLRRLAMTEIDE